MDLSYKNKSWLEEEYINQKKSCREISEEIDCSKSTILKWLNNFQIPRRIGLKGDKNPNWKGGIKYNQGHKLLMKKDHHRSDSQGYVREHIIIIEKKIGREIKDSEVVHHINNIKDDNRPENLVLCDNMAEHRKIERQLMDVGYELLKKGIIEFDHSIKRYEINV